MIGNIPKVLQVMDTILKVEYTNIPGAIGFSDYHNDKILIDPTLSESGKEEVFYHELVHWILFKMGNELESDEKFVGMFGALLNQAVNPRFKITKKK